jgi:DNA polymerase-3 subunit epsilon
VRCFRRCVSSQNETSVYQTASPTITQAAIDFHCNNRPSFAIIDGNEERSFIWVENGHFYGMGYLDTEMGITDLSEIREYVTPYPSNQYITDLLLYF